MNKLVMATVQKSTEDRKPSKIKTSADKSDKKYATLSSRSVALMVESAGLPPVSTEIATVLAQDVCYRLRETAQASTQFMKHAKRRRLTVDDFNKALKWSDVQPIHGYGSHRGLGFTKGESDVYFVEDKEVDLASTSLDLEVPATGGKHTVRASWLSLDGVPRASSSFTAVNHNLSDLSEELQKYYHEVTKVILDKEAEGIKMVLEDLVANPKVSSLLPYLVNFIESGVKTVSHDLLQLNRLLQTVDAMLRNKSLFLGPYISKLIGSVTYCTLEPLAASINPLNDHWSLRVYASRLLYPLVRGCHLQPAGLFSNLLQTLKDVLSDSSQPLCSHYGAVISLAALGPQAIEEVLVPVLPVYWQFLQPILDDNSVSSTRIREDGQKVHGAIQNAAEICLRDKYHSLDVKNSSCTHKQESSSSVDPNDTRTSLEANSDEVPHPTRANELYSIFYEYLGDSLSLRLCSEGFFNLEQPAVGVTGDRVHLLDLVNEKVVFNGKRFQRNRGQTGEDENKAKMRSLGRPSKLGVSARGGLRRRPGKVLKRQRSDSQCLKEAFPLAKNVRTYGRLNLSSFLSLPSYIEPLPVREWPPIPQEQRSTVESDMYRVSQKMKTVGKRKITKAFRGVTPFYLGLLL